MHVACSRTIDYEPRKHCDIEHQQQRCDAVVSARSHCFTSVICSCCQWCGATSSVSVSPVLIGVLITRLWIFVATVDVVTGVWVLSVEQK